MTLNVQSYNFTGAEQGPNILILGAIHGNEKCGTKAIKAIMARLNSGDLSLKSGRITFVPICNPRAYAENKRYIDVNLNRVIGHHDGAVHYEQHLANEIAALIDAHDFVLDLHSIHSQSAAFAFLDDPHPDAQALCAHLDVEVILTGWPEMYEASEDCTTQEYAGRLGKGAVTVECGQHDDPAAIDAALDAIIKTCAFFDMIDQKITPNAQSMFIQAKHKIVKNAAGQLIEPMEHLSTVRKGDVLANYEDGSSVNADEDGYILLPFKEANIGDEWFYIGSAA